MNFQRNGNVNTPWFQKRKSALLFYSKGATEGPDSEKIKRKMCNKFKENGLNITVECNLAITDILNSTFNLKSGTYYPYRKQQNSQEKDCNII